MTPGPAGSVGRGRANTATTADRWAGAGRTGHVQSVHITGFFLNMIGFVLNMTGFVLNMTIYAILQVYSVFDIVFTNSALWAELV